MSVGKFSNSLSSATVENSASFIQLNFDFTLFKTEAPSEYKPVGQALSTYRRLNAETGAAHRTARKLGWLFEQVIPDTPELLKAYGLRVCDILRKPGINPTGSTADGPFREYVGADCTSLWAAATSGIPALGVHLLACMLARAWDAKIATAIWVELVKARQAEVLSKLGQNYNVSKASEMAARQDFLRSELAEWDTSARAWLARADEAQTSQRDQYLLIVKNVSLMTGNNTSPYRNVISAWTHAMITMERHLEGISQQVSDGGILYAISAWHLFPDLVYFGSGVKHIRFSDPLFTRHAVITLGLHEIASSPENSGPHWSLALSDLRFYGDPVPVESQEDRTRVSILQFQIILLGSVLESWRVPLNERLNAIKWVCALWTYLETTSPFDREDMPFSIHTSWLAGLAKAANHVLLARDEALEQCEDYLSHGERWGSRFLLDLNRQYQELRPYFGLCNPSIMASLQEPLDIDAGVEYLRQLAKHMGLKDNEAIICYSDRRIGYYEYCTAVSHSDPIHGDTHARWIKIRKISQGLQKYDTDFYPPCYKESAASRGSGDIDIDFRINMLRGRGEQCFEIGVDSLHDEDIFAPQDSYGLRKKVRVLLWDNPAPLFADIVDDSHVWSSKDDNANHCSCLAPPKPTMQADENSQSIHSRRPRFTLYKSTNTIDRRENFDFYIRTDSEHVNQIVAYDSRLSQAIHQSLAPSVGCQWLQSSLPHPNRVWDYIQCFAQSKTEPGLALPEQILTPSGLDWEISHGRAADLISNNIMSKQPADWLRSLELVRVIDEIYKRLPGATISLEVIEYPLIEAHWTAIPHTPKDFEARGVTYARGTGAMLKKMDRESSLACVAMMQTGVSNIKPSDLKEVMAMSSANSIFVAASLLTDPHEIVVPWDIRHIIGNVGYPGLNLMVAPAGVLRICRPKNEVQPLSNRSGYNYKREDKFNGSSLHLSFTGQRFPLVTTDIDTIDQDVFYLQSVVSLWDDGKHIADLNMLNIERENITRVNLDCHCAEAQTQAEGMDVRALDSWQDILRRPQRTAIMRAYQNWSARLAAMALLIQQEKGHIVAILGKEPLCWKCLKDVFAEPEPHLPEILID
jgi:hypothetical protein